MSHIERRSPFCTFSAWACALVLFVGTREQVHAGTVTAEAVRAAGIETLRSYAAANKLDIESDIPHACGMEVKGVEVPVLRASLAVKDIHGTSVPVRVEVLNGSGEVIRTLHLVARVKVFAEAAVAARDIARGDSLAAGDIVMKRVEVGGVRGYYTSAEELAGVRVTATIRSGSILRASNIKPAPVVRRGDRVTIKVVVGSVEASSEGIARQDGGLGECIRVYNEMTRSTALCRILDSHTVQVGKGGG